MKLRALPDPAAPGGGFGYLVTDEAEVQAAPVTIQVLDAYSDRWLGAPVDEGLVTVGDGNWQSEPFAFGPYSAQAQGNEVWIRIGPEIVNKVGEYTPLRITIADKTADLVWPDDVQPRIAPALVGAIQSTAARTTEIERPRTELVEEPGEPDTSPEDVQEEQEVVEQPGGVGWLLWIFVLAAVLAGAVAYYLWPEAEAPESSGIAYEPDREATPPVPCSHAAIAEAGGGFVAMEAALRDCGPRISANEAIRVLEMGAREGSPDALLLFGVIYDMQQKDNLIETTVGLTFKDDPATAAEYYHRAKTAGSPEAESLLIVTCGRLSKLSTTLARGAFDDYCSKP